MAIDLLISNVRVALPDRITGAVAVAVSGGSIERVAEAGCFRDCAPAQTCDGQGRVLAPGFIDLHFHGCREFLADDGPEALAGLCRTLPEYGVTGFLPTLCPRPAGEDAAYLRSLSVRRYGGAGLLAFHLEGPFLTLTGAMPPESLGRADPDRVRRLQEAAGAYGAIFSIAPEFAGIESLLPLMTAQRRPAFITHTRADVAQTRRAIDLGARHATHFYDVFPIPAERDPGVRPCGAVEAVLADPRTTVDFILDGEHVEAVAVELALRCKGDGGVCLITDANIGAGLSPGRYRFGRHELEFRYAGGPARMPHSSSGPGILAGSGLTMNRAVANAVRMLGLSLHQAVRMASTNPAAVLSLQGKKGIVAAGADADLVLLEEDLSVCRTWVAGQCVFDRKAQPPGRRIA
jgi:N-acetylglucosamine-6-phosphate deacetylase